MFKSRAWLLFVPSLAIGAPKGMQVSEGTASINTSGQTTTITTQSQNTALQFSSFDIATKESVNISQPGNTSRTLCHIPSTQPTQIEGRLGSNGTVYIVNPAGVIFGPKSRINVAGLVAAASNIKTDDFIKHIDLFDGGVWGEKNGPVIFEGRAAAKFVKLMGSNVTVSGIIEAENSIAIAAGAKVLFGEKGSHVLISKVDRRLLEGQSKVGIQLDGKLEAKRIALGVGDIYSVGIHQGRKGAIKADTVDIMAYAPLVHEEESWDISQEIAPELFRLREENPAYFTLMALQDVHLEGSLENIGRLNIVGKSHNLSKATLGPNQDVLIAGESLTHAIPTKLKSLKLNIASDLTLKSLTVDTGVKVDAKSVIVKGDLKAQSVDINSSHFTIDGKLSAPRRISIMAPWNLGARPLQLESQKICLGKVSASGGIDLKAKDIYTYGNLTTDKRLSINGALHISRKESGARRKSLLFSGSSVIFSSDLDVGYGLDVGSASTDEIIFRGNVYSSGGKLGDLGLETRTGGVVLGVKNFGATSSSTDNLRLGNISVSQGINEFSPPSLEGYFRILGKIYSRGLQITSAAGRVELLGDISTNLSGSDGGEVDVIAYGSITIEGNIDTSSKTLSSRPIAGAEGGDVSLVSAKGDVKVKDIVTDGADGLVQGGGAGNITLKASFDKEVTHELVYVPNGRIFLMGGLISAKGGSSQGVYYSKKDLSKFKGWEGYEKWGAFEGYDAEDGASGILYLGRTQTDRSTRDYYPALATISGDPEGSDIFVDVGRVITSRNEVWTQLGSLKINASKSIQLGDHIALGNLTLTAPEFYIYRHTPGRILVANGSSTDAPSVQAVAGGKIRQSGDVYVLGEGGDFHAESLQLSQMQQATMRKILIFDGNLLNIDSSMIQSMVPSVPPLCELPPLAPAYEYAPKLTNTEAAPLTVLAKMIESDLSQTAPSELPAWHALRDEVLASKNPIEGPINVYDRKVAFGFFDPNRFIDGLSVGNRGKKALSYLRKVSHLLGSLNKVKSKQGRWIHYLVNRFTKPINISEHNWEDIQTVAVYRETKAKEYQNKRGRISF